MGVGQVITGGSGSLIVTLKLQEAELLHESTAMQITALVPMGKVEPLEGLQVTLVPEQWSVTAAE
jgi:hypothetical protein